MEKVKEWQVNSQDLILAQQFSLQIRTFST